VVTTVTTTIVSPTLSIPSPTAAPLSAIAARRQQQLLGTDTINSKASTPEIEEHISSDNLDVEDDDKASLDSGASDSENESGSDDPDEGEESVGIKGTAISVPQYEKRERKYVGKSSYVSLRPGDRKELWEPGTERIPLFFCPFRVYSDPQSVSSFRPSRYNVAYLPSTESPNITIVGLHRGEVRTDLDKEELANPYLESYLIRVVDMENCSILPL